MRRLRVAFIKFNGLSAGGSEWFIQSIAANLPKPDFEVDFLFTDAAPYLGADVSHAGIDPHRRQYLEDQGVRLIQVALKAKDIRTPTHDWVDTDFWKKFDENRYDLIQTARAGHPEFPFCKIRNVPIVDSLHLVAGVDNQRNVSRVIHTSEWSARRWIAFGGDPDRVRVVYQPMRLLPFRNLELRRTLGLGQKIVFGLHQRRDDDIFSPIPLAAFAKIANAHNHFIVLGGSNRYRLQAQALGLQNVTFLPHSANRDDLYSFLAALDIYAHGRKDGEINSTAIAEAMGFGLPVISHTSSIHNGHVETIGEGGLVSEGPEDYAEAMSALASNPERRRQVGERAKRRFAACYDHDRQLKKMAAIYDEVASDPFPNRIRRWRLEYQQKLFGWKWQGRLYRALSVLRSNDFPGSGEGTQPLAGSVGNGL